MSTFEFDKPAQKNGPRLSIVAVRMAAKPELYARNALTSTYKGITSPHIPSNPGHRILSARRSIYNQYAFFVSLDKACESEKLYLTEFIQHLLLIPLSLLPARFRLCFYLSRRSRSSSSRSDTPTSTFTSSTIRSSPRISRITLSPPIVPPDSAPR